MFLVIENSYAINIGRQRSFIMIVFLSFGQMPRSGIVGSYGISIFFFLKSFSISLFLDAFIFLFYSLSKLSCLCFCTYIFLLKMKIASSSKCFRILLSIWLPWTALFNSILYHSTLYVPLLHFSGLNGLRCLLICGSRDVIDCKMPSTVASVITFNACFLYQ